MIGHLQGAIIHKQPDHILLEVHGVSYEIAISFTSYCQLPDINQSTGVYTHLVVRDDAHCLYGFVCIEERALFRLLIKVNGVGPKMALAILSGLELTTLVTCVQNQDITTMTKIPGVGQKTAARLMIELRDKIGNCFANVHQPTDSTTSKWSPTGAQEEATGALIALGYKPTQATKAVTLAIKQAPNGNSETLIRLALKGML